MFYICLSAPICENLRPNKILNFENYLAPEDTARQSRNQKIYISQSPSSREQARIGADQ